MGTNYIMPISVAISEISLFIETMKLTAAAAAEYSYSCSRGGGGSGGSSSDNVMFSICWAITLMAAVILI